MELLDLAYLLTGFAKAIIIVHLCITHDTTGVPFDTPYPLKAIKNSPEKPIDEYVFLFLHVTASIKLISTCVPDCLAIR